MSDFHCTVSLDLVRRAMLCASTEEPRYYVNGVYVEPHHDQGAFIVATNGHILVCFHDAEAVISGSAILNPSKAILATKPPKACRYVLTLPELRLIANSERMAVMADVVGEKDKRSLPTMDLAAPPTADVLAYQASEATIDGPFPDWRRVMPRDVSESCSGAFSVNHVLAPLAKALAAPESKAHPLRLYQGTQGKDSSLNPALAYGSDPRGFGVAMPMLGLSHEKPALPAWF